jgi:simple sugar transport system substrate-binding protein/ribose transport system substrate-binding protein
MKLKVSAIALLSGMLLSTSVAAEPVSVDGFDLAPRIREKVAAGGELNIFVSYHDTSNEFAPSIREGVERGDAMEGVAARFIGPVGADADAQISEIETLMNQMDGLAISSVSIWCNPGARPEG